MRRTQSETPPLPLQPLAFAEYTEITIGIIYHEKIADYIIENKATGMLHHEVLATRDNLLIYKRISSRSPQRVSLSTSQETSPLIRPQKARTLQSPTPRARSRCRRRRRCRLRRLEIRRRSHRLSRFPLRRKVNFPLQNHQNQVRSSSLLLHHSHRHPGCTRVWRCRNSDPGFAGYY
jgi:hypothetical protein